MRASGAGRLQRWVCPKNTTHSYGKTKVKDTSRMNPQNVSTLIFLETPKHGEDTGLGLEQIVAIRQGQASEELEFTCQFGAGPIPTTNSPISRFAPI